MLFKIALAVISWPLGLGRYAPNAAINGDMGWLSPEHSQWMCIARKWCRLVNMDESLLAKKIFLSYLNQGSTNRKIWCYRVKMFFIEIEHEHICQGHRLAVRATLNTINSQLHVYFERIWKENWMLNLQSEGKMQEVTSWELTGNLRKSMILSNMLKWLHKSDIGQHMLSLDAG